MDWAPHKWVMAKELEMSESGAGSISPCELNAVLSPPSLKTISLYIWAREVGDGSFLLHSLMAGSGIKCSFVFRETISKELVWSFPIVVTTEENE